MRPFKITCLLRNWIKQEVTTAATKPIETISLKALNIFLRVLIVKGVLNKATREHYLEKKGNRKEFTCFEKAGRCGI